MKTAEATTTVSRTAAQPRQQEGAFFGSEQSFFNGHQNSTATSKNPFFQPKPTVGPSDDVYEREADAVAEEVVASLSEPPQTKNVSAETASSHDASTVQPKCATCEAEEHEEQPQEGEQGELRTKKMGAGMPQPPPGVPIQRKCAACAAAGKHKKVRPKRIQRTISRLGSAHVSRKCAACAKEEVRPKREKGKEGGEAPDGFDAKLSANRGGGSPLQNGVRQNMETAFGTDFSGVRIHTGNESAGMNRQIGARAFTHGNDIYFNRGEYRPETPNGQFLLAHELTHTVQQGGGDHQINRQEEPSNEVDPDTLSGIPKIRYILEDNDWVGPMNEYDLESEWQSFGSNLPSMVNANYGLWTQSIARGAELEDLPQIAIAEEQFKEDVKNQALAYLNENETFIDQELASIGVAPNPNLDTSAEVSTEEAATRLLEMRNMAREINDARQLQSMLQRIQVGYDYDVGLMDVRGRNLVDRRNLLVSTFNPHVGPHRPPFGDESPPMIPYTEVKTEYDKVAGVISGISSQYPAIYALMEQGRLNELVQADNPHEARVLITEALNEVRAKINETRNMLASDDLDYRDLTPIHHQLMGGEKWSQPYYSWVANNHLEDHQATAFWISLGLGSLAAAGFLVANLASFGSVTFFLAAGVGLGAGALEAGRSWERYGDLATAAEAEVSAELQLVFEGQANMALISSIISTVFLFMQTKGMASMVGNAGSAGGRGALSGLSRRLRALMPSGGGAAFARAEAQVTMRTQVLMTRLQNAVRNQNWATGRLAEQAARSQVRDIRAMVRLHVRNIRNGTGALGDELRGLSQAQRDQLASQMQAAMNQEIDNAIANARMSAIMREFTDVSDIPNTPSTPQGYGPRGAGGPPVRRPRSGHHGEGWGEGW